MKPCIFQTGITSVAVLLFMSVISCGHGSNPAAGAALDNISRNWNNADSLRALRSDVRADSATYASLPVMSAGLSPHVRGTSIALALSPVDAAGYVIDNMLTPDICQAVMDTYRILDDEVSLSLFCTSLQQAFDCCDAATQAKYVSVIGNAAVNAALLDPDDADLCRELRRIYSNNADTLAVFEQSLQNNKHRPSTEKNIH